MGQEQTQPTQFADTPVGWAARLKTEFEAARKAIKPWHEQAEKAIKAYLDEEDAADTQSVKWNVYTADTQTKEAILFGNPPRTSVSRRYADAKDDVARVAAEIMERLVNADIEGEDDSFTEAVEYAHQDRERVAFGLCRIRYVMGETQVVKGQPAMVDPMTGMERAPAVPDRVLRPNEQVETDYIHWKDALWGSCRVWHEMPWIAFKAQMTQREVSEKFGEDIAAEVPYSDNKTSTEEPKVINPWSRVDVWEVWVKEDKQVFFFIEGFDRVLTPKDLDAMPSGAISDPLGLTGFWPCPRPMFGNASTSKMLPKPDREFSKYQYAEINNLTERQALLAQALRVVGVYDKTNKGLAQMLDGSLRNELLPVDNWAMFAEKGGIKGAIDWFPLEQVVNTMLAMRERVNDLLDQARQITGMSDIMRGQASPDGAKTATEQRIKARTGSVRMEQREKELARFVSGLQRLRGEVIAKHFDESTILARCNCENTADAELAPQAVKLLKSDFAKYRIEVKPETIALTDFDAVKQESIEVIGAVSSYFQALGPLIMQAPAAAPYAFELLQALVARLKGASTLEGILDRAIQAAQTEAAKPKEGPPPDPKLMAQQAKTQGDLAKVKADTEGKIQVEMVKVQADSQREQNQMIFNVREAQAKAQISHAMKAAEPTKGPFDGGGR